MSFIIQNDIENKKEFAIIKNNIIFEKIIQNFFEFELKKGFKKLNSFSFSKVIHNKEKPQQMKINNKSKLEVSLLENKNELQLIEKGVYKNNKKEEITLSKKYYKRSKSYSKEKKLLYRKINKKKNLVNIINTDNNDFKNNRININNIRDEETSPNILTNKITISNIDEKKQDYIIPKFNQIKGNEIQNNANLHYLCYSNNESRTYYNTINNINKINNNFINKYSNNYNIFKNQQQNNINENNAYLNQFLLSPLNYRKNKNKNPYIYEYKINKVNNYREDKNIAKIAKNLLKTQSGCCLLKEKLSNNYFANELLFPEIKSNIKEICCSIIGSSFINCLLDVLSYENIDSFLSLINEDLFEICLTEPGSRVIQKLIEIINNFPLLLNKFIFDLSCKDIGFIIKSQYGNHIFRTYLSLVKKEEYTNFIYYYIFYDFLGIMQEKYGICVIIKALSEANENKKKKIFEIILKYFMKIIKNSYGNYLIQHLFLKYEKKNFKEMLPFIQKIEENIVDYCKCQYSSSVIEKCIEKGEKEISEHLVKYLLDYHLNSIIDIIDNSYGVYVIIKALKINNKNLKDSIIQFIANNIYKFKKGNVIKIISSLSVKNKEIYDKFCKQK